MNDTIFINGLIIKKPNERAPDYVIAKISIKKEELIEWLNQQDGEWINGEVKESRGGNFYASLDTYTPTKDEEYKKGAQQARESIAEEPPPFFDDEMPF